MGTSAEKWKTQDCQITLLAFTFSTSSSTFCSFHFHYVDTITSQHSLNQNVVPEWIFRNTSATLVSHTMHFPRHPYLNHPLGATPTKISNGRMLVKNALVCCGVGFWWMFGFCGVGSRCWLPVFQKCVTKHLFCNTKLLGFLLMK